SLPRVQGAERRMAGVGFGACAGHVAEDPLELRAGEIGVDHEAGLAFDRWGKPAGFQLVAASGGAAILPHDGVMYRLAGLSVPDDGGFPLVRDPNGRDVRGGEARLPEGLLGGVQLRGP